MESKIVKLNNTGEYFYVSFNPYQMIDEVKLVKNKEEATLFQKDALVLENEKDTKINIGESRMKTFSLYLHYKGIKADDVTIETIDAPEQHFLTKKQMKEIRIAMCLIIA